MITYELMMRHVNEGISIRNLAKEIGIHHNTLRRAMIKAGIPIQKAGESLSNSIKSGKAKTRKGATITEEHRLILAKANKGRKREVQTKNNYILKKNQVARADGARGNRKASQVGSKFERLVFDKLVSLGYNVTQQHKIEEYKIDLFLPDFMIAIEIDGISHSEPIYGVDRLQATKQKDREKDDCMRRRGMHILRVSDKQRNPGKLNCHYVVQKIKDMIPRTQKELHVYETMEIN